MLTQPKKQYECCSNIIDIWIETVAHGRTNIAPKNIPWDMIRILITEMYGGKIDSEHDFTILTELVTSIMDPAAFEEGHKIVKPTAENDETSLEVPSGTAFKAFVDWVNELPEREPPTYLGLPANAEKLLLVGQAKTMVGNLKLVADLLDEGEQVMAEAQEGSNGQ